MTDWYDAPSRIRGGAFCHLWTGACAGHDPNDTLPSEKKGIRRACKATADTADLREHLPAAVATDLPEHLLGEVVDTARPPEPLLPVVVVVDMALLPAAVVATERRPKLPVGMERRLKRPVATERRLRRPVVTEHLPEVRWSRPVLKAWLQGP